MSNCPPGGYILIGVTDAGEPCIPIGTLDRQRFDAARLADLVRGYVEGRVTPGKQALKNLPGCDRAGRPGEPAARRGRDLLLADQFGRTCAAVLFRVNTSQWRKWVATAGAMDSGRRPGILPNIGWRQT